MQLLLVRCLTNHLITVHAQLLFEISQGWHAAVVRNIVRQWRVTPEVKALQDGKNN